MSTWTRNLVVIVAAQIIGCGAASLYDSVNEPKDDVALKECREKGHAEREAGATEDKAFDVYRECRESKGLK